MDNNAKQLINEKDFIDIENKIIYEKELKIAYFLKHPGNSYDSFLSLLIDYVKKGYQIKDKRENRTYTDEIESMLYNKMKIVIKKNGTAEKQNRAAEQKILLNALNSQ